MIINPNRIRIYVPHCIVGDMNRFINYVTTTWNQINLFITLKYKWISLETGENLQPDGLVIIGSSLKD